MKYVAFLRGINVGGNNIIKMVDLKACFEEMEFGEVATLIQSGNVIFESDEKDSGKLEKKIEDRLEKAFKIPIKVLIRSLPQIKKVLSQVPEGWKTRKDIRCYIAFVKSPAKPQDVIKEITLKEGVDSVSAGDGAVFMTTLLSGITKSGFSKIAGKPIYKEITIRNYNTTQKIAGILES